MVSRLQVGPADELDPRPLAEYARAYLAEVPGSPARGPAAGLLRAALALEHAQRRRTARPLRVSTVNPHASGVESPTCGTDSHALNKDRLAPESDPGPLIGQRGSRNPLQLAYSVKKIANESSRSRSDRASNGSAVRLAPGRGHHRA